MEKGSEPPWLHNVVLKLDKLRVKSSLMRLVFNYELTFHASCPKRGLGAGLKKQTNCFLRKKKSPKRGKSHHGKSIIERGG